MPNPRIIPNRTTSPLPPHPSHTIMIPHNQTQNILPYPFILRIIHPINLRNMHACACEDAAPACDAVCADDGVNRGEFGAGVYGGASGCGDGVVAEGAGAGEDGLGAGGG